MQNSEYKVKCFRNIFFIIMLLKLFNDKYIFFCYLIRYISFYFFNAGRLVAKSTVLGRMYEKKIGRAHVCNCIWHERLCV